MDTEHLLFRRQFIMGPQRIVPFSNWRTEVLPGGYYVSAHPDLKIIKINNFENCIVLLGYIIDPFSPDSTDEELLEEVAKKCVTIKELTCKFDCLAGRYICIAYLQGKYYLFNDTLGFRQVYYYESVKKIWCASQPSLLAEWFGFKCNEETESDLFGLKLFRDGGEYWYPGNITLFKEITHLIPNHYLDFCEGCQIRFWPDGLQKKVLFEEGVEKCAVLLRQLLESAGERFELDVAVTSGLDSRMLLAASRSISSKIKYFTHTHQTLGVSGADVVVPSDMLKRLGLQHTVVFHSDNIDPDFERVFRRNVTTARISKGINAFAVHRHFSETGKENVIVHGVTGEITRNFYTLPPVVSLNAEVLGVLTGMSSSKTAIKQFDLWLKDVQGVTSKNGIQTLDLFHWEQRIANWAAMSYSEYDIAYESFSPFSCRTLLSTMLSVEYKYRIAPHFTLQKAIIGKIWPELLGYEINPPAKGSSVFRKNMKSSILNRLHMSLLLFKYSQLFRKNFLFLV
jgi:hypothetical protein